MIAHQCWHLIFLGCTVIFVITDVMIVMDDGSNNHKIMMLCPELWMALVMTDVMFRMDDDRNDHVTQNYDTLCLPSKCPKWRMTPVMTVVMARMDDDRAKSRDRRRWLTAQLSWTVLRIVMMTLLIRSSTCGYQWYQHVSWFWLRNRCWFGSRHSCGLMPLSEFRHNRRSRIASPFTSGVTVECQRYQQGINPHSHRVSQVRAWQESDNFKSSWIIHFDLIRSSPWMIFPRQIIERHTSSSLFSGLNKIFFNLSAESSPFLSPILTNVNTTRSKHWHNSKSWLQIGCSKISDLSIRLFFKRHRKSCHIPLHQSSFHQTHFKATPGSHIGVSHVLSHELSSNVPQVTCQLSNMSQASSFSQFPVI